jgi:hypothetical protein
MVREDDRPDRFASGTRGGETGDSADNETMPGVTGGGKIYLPESGREGAQGSGASSAEGTIGAVGEMDITGAPVEAGGSSSAGESEGGGPGGGAMSRGGTGTGTDGSDTSDTD